jgi:rhamnose utilization protein RhaD (predicted bifunctional aldolase and dehydrogenase)
MEKVKTFKYVDYLWDENKAAALGDDQVALFLYRSNILGADLRITNYGGEYKLQNHRKRSANQ